MTGTSAANTALIMANGIIELDTVAIIDLDIAVVIHPGHPEADHPVGIGQPLQQRLPAILFFIALDGRAQGFQYFLYRLVKFRLVGIVGDDLL